MIVLALQVESLQRQVSNLAATQTNNEDITSRTKTDYAVLQARYYMLEVRRDSELPLIISHPIIICPSSHDCKVLPVDPRLND